GRPSAAEHSFRNTLTVTEIAITRGGFPTRPPSAHIAREIFSGSQPRSPRLLRQGGGFFVYSAAHRVAVPAYEVGNGTVLSCSMPVASNDAGCAKHVRDKCRAELIAGHTSPQRARIQIGRNERDHVGVRLITHRRAWAGIDRKACGPRAAFKFARGLRGFAF